MEYFADLLVGAAGVTWKHMVMWLIGFTLIYLAIKKGYEPLLLLPIGFGSLLANIPFSSAIDINGPLTILRQVGIANELFPIFMFIAIGAMCDFTPLLKNPLLMIFGGAAQCGIFLTIVLAVLLNFPLTEATAIGILGTADGPTTIYVANKFAPRLLGPLAVAAYTYMSLVPIIQPLVIKALTTKNERLIRMPNNEVKVSKTAKILFPIMVMMVAGILIPLSVALVGFLMLGNLLRESGVVERLSKSAQNELANLVTLFLGIAIGGTMTAESFLTVDTLMVMTIGMLAFLFGTAGGVIIAKVMNLFLKEKINPMIGAAGLSAFPMSARVVAKLALQEDRNNFLIMHSAGANASGQLGSVIAGGVILALARVIMGAN